MNARWKSFIPILVLVLVVAAFGPATARVSAATTRWITASPSAKLRAQATTGSTSLTTIPYGSKVTVQEIVTGQKLTSDEGTSNRWDKLSWGGKTGYVWDVLVGDSPPPGATSTRATTTTATASSSNSAWFWVTFGRCYSCFDSAGRSLEGTRIKVKWADKSEWWNEPTVIDQYNRHWPVSAFVGAPSAPGQAAKKPAAAEPSLAVNFLGSFPSMADLQTWFAKNPRVVIGAALVAGAYILVKSGAVSAGLSVVVKGIGAFIVASPAVAVAAILIGATILLIYNMIRR